MVSVYHLCNHYYKKMICVFFPSFCQAPIFWTLRKISEDCLKTREHLAELSLNSSYSLTFNFNTFFRKCFIHTWTGTKLLSTTGNSFWFVKLTSQKCITLTTSSRVKEVFLEKLIELKVGRKSTENFAKFFGHFESNCRYISKNSKNGIWRNNGKIAYFQLL